MNSSFPIAVKNLTKVYAHPSGRTVRALDNVSFEMKPGEILGLLGPNGAGKTTLISTIMTLEKPSSGEVAVFGRDVSRFGDEAKILTGFVPQELINHGYFSVFEILEFHSGYFGLRKNRERIEYLLHRLSLWGERDKKVKQLSGGMKRRLLIAKALVHEPKLLLLDEPTAGVDIQLRESLWKFVEELRSAGMSILLTTHYIQEAEELCDRIGIIMAGKLQHLVPTRDLISKLTQREVELTMMPGQESSDRGSSDRGSGDRGSGDRGPSDAAGSVAAESGWKSHRSFVREGRSERGSTLVFRLPPQQGVGELLLNLGISLKDIKDISVREGSLEDAFKRVLAQTSEAETKPEVVTNANA